MAKKLAYIVFNESIFDNLVKTQVIGLLSGIKEIEEEKLSKIYLINFLPITKFLKINEYKKESRELKKRGINYIFLPLTLHSRFYFFNILLPFFSFIYGKILKIVLFFLKVDILHCRSYFATVLALCAKRNEKVIFDTRSLFIEENISINKLKENSKAHKLWEIYEKELLNKSDVIVVIDEIFQEKYQEKLTINKDKFKIISIFVNDNLIYFDKKERDKLRKELKIEEKEVYIYTGSFYGWNDIDVYFEYFSKVIKGNKNVFFIVLTKQTELVERKIKQYGLDKRIFLYKSVENDKIKDYLSAADYGVILMKKNKDSETRLGVKFLEYISCDLKIITNNNVGLARKITEKNKIGINIDKKNQSVQGKGLSVEIYKKFYSSKKVLENYLELYSKEKK